MLLQRSPIIRVVADLQFSGGPRLAHIVKWMVGIGATSAFYNTVTGATGDLSSVGNSTAIEGSNMQVAVRAERAVPVTAEIEGDLPPGISSNLGEGGIVPFGTIAFSGIATTAGEYPVKVTILTWEDDSTYEGDPVFIEVDFEITLVPPEITKAPDSVQVPLGGTAELTVEVADPENTTFQWQRNVGSNLNQFANIAGATESVYSVENATPDVNGAYRVQVRKNGLLENSPSVFLTVSSEPTFGSWQVREFGDDSASDDAQPDANPDKDSFINAFEFLFDLSPNNPDSIQSPSITREEIGQIDYVVFTFPALIDFPDLTYSFESTTDLVNGPWIQLIHTLDDVIIESDENATVVKIPNTDEAYIRVKVDTD